MTDKQKYERLLVLGQLKENACSGKFDHQQNRKLIQRLIDLEMGEEKEQPKKDLKAVTKAPDAGDSIRKHIPLKSPF